jgi:hypothetical protein
LLLSSSTQAKKTKGDYAKLKSLDARIKVQKEVDAKNEEVAAKNASIRESMNLEVVAYM